MGLIYKRGVRRQRMPSEAAGGDSLGRCALHSCSPTRSRPSSEWRRCIEPIKSALTQMLKLITLSL